MTPTTDALHDALDQITTYVNSQTEDTMSYKSSQDHWSKKETIGHLIDSGLYNLLRFAEIQFQSRPYHISAYQQRELVEANRYQDSLIDEMLALLIAVNRRILTIVDCYTDDMLDLPIITPENEKADLRFLVKDYVDHFVHHTKQLTS
ncbi:MAG: DinB family protein [Bacteroidota bacterium]